MRKKHLITIGNIAFCIALAGLLILIAYILTPIHELFHAIPCYALGLEPFMKYAETSCPGVENIPHIGQFFFFMAPYIAYSLLLLIGYRYRSRHKLIPYILLIPAFDTIVNYFLTPKGSDFSFLLNNTYPDVFPFIIAMIIAGFVFWFTVFKIIIKQRLWNFMGK